jgi:hypothetical protein
VTSFIELPRLGFGGIALPSLYVNTADIISLVKEHDGQTKVEIRDLGSITGPASVKTYVPLNALLDALHVLAQSPGMHEWSGTTKRSWSEPISRILEDAANRERAAYTR